MAYVNRAAQAAAMWDQEWPALGSEGMAVMGALNECVYLVNTHHMVPILAEMGIKVGEFDVMATLRRAGAPYSLTPTALYAATMSSSGGMTARLDRLEALGMIERRPNPDDRRGTLVCLTKQGLATVNRIMPMHAANKTRMVAGLTAEERRQLAGILAKMIGQFDPESPEFIGGAKPTE